MSLIVNSIPKSGTYLVELVLRSWGIPPSGLHFSNREFWLFTGQSLDEIISNPHQFRHSEPLSVSIERLPRHAFAVAHLVDPEKCLKLFSERGVRTVFLVRDLRDCLISWMRFLADPRGVQLPAWLCEDDDNKSRFLAYLRSEGAGHFSFIVKQLAWLRMGIPVLHFEDLMSDRGSDAQRGAVNMLLEAAGSELDPDIAQERLIGNINQNTRTFSGVRSVRSDYIGEEAEAILAEIGVAEANKQLGYF